MVLGFDFTPVNALKANVTPLQIQNAARAKPAYKLPPVLVPASNPASMDSPMTPTKIPANPKIASPIAAKSLAKAKQPGACRPALQAGLRLVLRDATPLIARAGRDWLA